VYLHCGDGAAPPHSDGKQYPGQDKQHAETLPHTDRLTQKHIAKKQRERRGEGEQQRSDAWTGDVDRSKVGCAGDDDTEQTGSSPKS
jgi:hypothetical protein